jgi:hypothetical protein
MSMHIAKLFSRPLALASAALVIHIGAAAAADSTYGDAQAAARQVLLGPSRVEVAGASRNSEPQEHLVAYGDAQAAARQVLLGASHVEVAGASRRAEPRPVTYGDAQTAARQVLLGPSHASNAS